MAQTLQRDETSNLIASDKVEGTIVYTPQGERLGSVRNFMVDKRSGKAAYAVLEFGGLFGFGSEHYPLPWDMLTYDTDQEGYVVNLTREKIDAAPRYGSDDTPEYTDEFGRTVYGYYGMSYPAL